MSLAPHFRRRPRRRTPPNIITILVIVALVLLGRYYTPPSAPPQNPPSTPTVERPASEGQLSKVRRVVDGDTLLMDDGVRVRLQGIDTPETKKEGTPVQPFGPEASEFTRQLVEGKTVRLEFDRERFDQYGRTLAFVYLDDLLVNEEIIRQGFSTAQTQYSYRSDMKRRFVAAEQEARAKGIGIWTLPERAGQGKQRR